jgi:hypothetical protein
MKTLQLLIPLMQEKRQYKIQTISSLLSILEPFSWDNQLHDLGAKQIHALLHHTLYEVKEAACIGDQARAIAALGVWTLPAQIQPSLLQTSCGSVFVQHSEDAHLSQYIAGDTPLWILAPTKLCSQKEFGGSLVRDAVTIAATMGYGCLLEVALAVVVLMKPRALEEPTNSWSTTALPSTVYTDYQAHPALLAKNLIHESAHCWLNECLDMCGEVLPPDETFYSPWKEKRRSAYGMIHSGFAFSCVHNFLVTLLANDSGLSREASTACEQHLVTETRRLNQARSTIESALELLKSNDLRSMVLQELKTAT